MRQGRYQTVIDERAEMESRSRRSRRWWLLGPAFVSLSALGPLSQGCGARSELEDIPPPPAVPECVVDADCEGFDNQCRNVKCVFTDNPQGGAGGTGGSGVGAIDDVGSGQAIDLAAAGRCIEGKPVDCDDGDVCTIDTCEPETGTCEHGPASFDLDGDGFNGPREGTTWTDPDSCGSDCDDTNDRAFPGGIEVCDGADNDCNGVIDDNATFVPLDVNPVRISGDIAPAGTGGIAWNGTAYAALYTGSTDGFDIYRTMLTNTGEKIAPGEERVTAVNSDSAGGPVFWTGNKFGVAWQDRRDSDYEIYFNTLDVDGKKFGPDIRLTNASEFSINPDLGFTGQKFVVVWQDEREGQFDIYGQLLDQDGVTVLGGNVKITDTSTGIPNEAPAIAAHSGGIGLAWSRGDTAFHYIMFSTLNFDLQPVSGPIELTNGNTEAVYPVVVWNDDRYVIAWFDRTVTPAAIWGAAIDESGNVIVPPKPITQPGSARSRYPFLRALGDRLLLVFADDRDNAGGYELYSRVIDKELNGISPELRLTNAAGDSIYPKAAFGPDGEVGVLFRDDRTSEQHVWFTRLACEIP
jgi:hypothetical protein